MKRRRYNNFAAFGGGFTWGSIYLKWAYDKNKFKLKKK
jgi:3-oxoacyl-[acyl-carrier-protein] synthase III